MTIKVGEMYRGVYGGDACWLGVTRIDLRASGAYLISYRAFRDFRLPRFLWWMGTRAIDTGAAFVSRVEDAVPIDRGRAQRMANAAVVKSVQEVEVRYR